MNEYRYNEADHIHEILDQGVYKPLTGTSSMASVLAKPLTYWAAGLAVAKFGWINKGNKVDGFLKKEKRLKALKPIREEISTLTDEDYLKLLDSAYSAHATKLKDSADAGTDMHAVMEEYVKRCIDTNGGVPLAHLINEDIKLSILVDWSLKNVKKFLWSEVNCYSRELWLGGISDVGFEDKDGKLAILDFKSSKDVYLSQFWQCVGYAMQIEENGGLTADGELLFNLDKPIEYVAVLPFGMKKPEVKYFKDMESGKEAVRAMLTLYRKMNKNE